MSVRPLARWMRDEGRAGKENDGGDEGGRGDVAKHVHSMAQPTGNRSGMDPEQVRPVRSQEMQFGAAEVHTAVPHAAGQSAPATNLAKHLSAEHFHAHAIRVRVLRGTLRKRWQKPSIIPCEACSAVTYRRALYCCCCRGSQDPGVTRAPGARAGAGAAPPGAARR